MQRRHLGVLVIAAVFGAAAAQDQPAPPRVTLTTTLGAIEITLDPVGAPQTSAHMLRMFKTRHYVGAAIFRVEPGHVIQLGDLDAKLQYRAPPGKPVVLETATNTHARGTVSLARGNDPASGHSSFYFDLGDNKHLNADPAAAPNTTGYATFGKVTKGMEVLDAIVAAERAPEGGPFPGALPKVPIVITAVTVN
jgi:peptidyl-prolyl cis-trans isomerase A (cyclophilin A)